MLIFIFIFLGRFFLYDNFNHDNFGRAQMNGNLESYAIKFIYVLMAI